MPQRPFSDGRIFISRNSESRQLVLVLRTEFKGLGRAKAAIAINSDYAPQIVFRENH